MNVQKEILAVLEEEGATTAAQLRAKVGARATPEDEFKPEMVDTAIDHMIERELILAIPGGRWTTYRAVLDVRELGAGGHTVAYKGREWPITDRWAMKHLTPFREFVAWETGSISDTVIPFDPEHPALWAKLYALLRKSEQNYAARTIGLTHDEVKARMADPEFRRAVIETLSPEEIRELRAVEAHLIVRNRVDFLLGRDLSEIGVDFINHAHGEGTGIPACGCFLTWVLDDWRHARAIAGDEATKTHHAHYPRHICARHSHLNPVLDALGRWHNMPLADRLAHINETVLTDPLAEARPDAAAA